MKKLSLPDGATGFTSDTGEWVCTGSQMGRRNVLPDDRSEPCKLRLARLRLVDGGYDQWGAYWGSPAPELLEALEMAEIPLAILVSSGSPSFSQSSHDGHKQVLQMVRAAIAKARGE